jgi:hypothetical protein
MSYDRRTGLTCVTTEVTWLLRPPLDRDGIPELCDQLSRLIACTGAVVVICDVDAFAEPDVVLVDTLARLQLTARRLGASIQLARASPRLQILLALIGLGHAVPLAGHLRRELEEGEDPLGVEEVVEAGDLAF